MRTSLTICTLDLPAQILGSGLDGEALDQEDRAAGSTIPSTVWALES